MAGVPPNPTTAVAGQPAKSSLQFNALALQVAFLLTPPLALMRQSVAQSLANSTFVAVLFDLEDLDREGGHSTTTNTSRYTAQTAGYYECKGQVTFSGNATGAREAGWLINGSVQQGTQAGPLTVPNAGALSVSPVTKELYLNVGDYVELGAFQSSGGALNTLLSGSYIPSMSVRWVST